VRKGGFGATRPCHGRFKATPHNFHRILALKPPNFPAVVIRITFWEMASANGQGVVACLPFPVNSHSYAHSLKIPWKGGRHRPPPPGNFEGMGMGMGIHEEWQTVVAAIIYGFVGTD